MRYVKLADIELGMVVGCDLMDDFGAVMATKGDHVDLSLLQRMELLDIDGMYEWDDYSVEALLEPPVSSQLRNEAMDAIRSGNVEGCMEVSRKMVKEMMAKTDINLDLNRLRTMDTDTYTHSVNVAIFSCAIGIGLKLGDYQLTEIVTAALLHDFGKLSIPNEIINKPSRLTVEEFDIMKSHSQKSYDYIKDRDDLSEAVKSAILSHHENLDGTGYPNHSYGEQQNLITKILHVADVYDALISKRPYKDAYSPADAIEYLMGGCGFMFEKEVVESLVRYVPFYTKGSEIRLSDGRRCIVMENRHEHNLRPVVRLVQGREVIDLADPKYLNLTIDAADKYDEKEIIKKEQERNQMIGKKDPVVLAQLEEERAAYYEEIMPAIKPTIMVVDDMVTNLQALRSILEPDYRVVLLKSGWQAINYVRTNKAPDLMLVDIDMPEIDGIETVKTIKQVKKKGEIPFLFVSALADRNTVTKCMKLHPAGFVARPYTPIFIKSEIYRILLRRGNF